MLANKVMKWHIMNVGLYYQVGSRGDWEARKWIKTEGLNFCTTFRRFLCLHLPSSWPFWNFVHLTRCGFLCLHPLDSGRSQWSLGWTTGGAKNNLGEKNSGKICRAGVSREHRVESPIYVLFNPWLPDDPTHMSRWKLCSTCISSKRGIWRRRMCA